MMGQNVKNLGVIDKVQAWFKDNGHEASSAMIGVAAAYVMEQGYSVEEACQEVLDAPVTE